MLVDGARSPGEMSSLGPSVSGAASTVTSSLPVGESLQTASSGSMSYGVNPRSSRDRVAETGMFVTPVAGFSVADATSCVVFRFDRRRFRGRTSKASLTPPALLPGRPSTSRRHDKVRGARGRELLPRQQADL